MTTPANLRQQRALRLHYFDPALLGEPVWDMLLALAETENPISVTSATHASGKPYTTALRHLDLMQSGGLIRSAPSPHDAQVRLITATPETRAAMAAYLKRIA